MIEYCKRDNRPKYINEQRRKVVEVEDVYGFGILIMEVLFGVFELVNAYGSLDITAAYKPLKSLRKYESFLNAVE